MDNQVVAKVDLCEACAQKKGLNDPASFSLADLRLGLGGSGSAGNPPPPP